MIISNSAHSLYIYQPGFFFLNSSCGLFKSMTYLFLLFSMCYSHYCIDFDEKLSQIWLFEAFPHLVHDAFLCLHNWYVFISYVLETKLGTLYILDNQYTTGLQPYPHHFSFSLTLFSYLVSFRLKVSFPRSIFLASVPVSLGGFRREWRIQIGIWVGTLKFRKTIFLFLLYVLSSTSDDDRYFKGFLQFSISK